MGIFSFKSNKTVKVNTFKGKTSIIIDGVDVTPETNEKQITIIIEGSPENVNVDVCDSMTINGSCKTVSSQTGNITVKDDVSGNLKCGTGEVQCGNVGGDVESGTGDIKVNGNIQGNVSSGTGNIKFIK